MRIALGEARRAAAAGEVPVGAVVVGPDRILARAGNRMERTGDATAHAELLAIQRAARKQPGKRLADCRLYVTLEPCPQCAGAIVLARLSQVVFATRDPKAGAFGSVADFPLSGRMNHVPRVTEGVLSSESEALLRQFFSGLRKKER